MAVRGGDRSSSGDAERLAAVLDEYAGALVSVWNSHHLQAPVSGTQLRVLFVVARYGSVNVTRVAEELGALLSSASRLCARLEATGLLERSPGPDRRAIEVRLTEQGRTLLAELRRDRRAEMAAVLAEMDPADCAALLTGLEGFHAALQRHGDQSDPGVSMPA